MNMQTLKALLYLLSNSRYSSYVDTEKHLKVQYNTNTKCDGKPNVYPLEGGQVERETESASRVRKFEETGSRAHARTGCSSVVL